MRKSGKNIMVASIVTSIVVAAVIGGIILLDSPAQERLRRFDERRVGDLRELAYALDRYWTREGTLPSLLEELSNEPGVFVELFDPETEQPYEYRVLGDKTFELCAVFARDRGTDGRDFPDRRLWLHGTGRQCFQLEAQNVSRVPEMR